MRRLAAMKYRLAVATSLVIAEKLTEERAQAFAVEKGISFERAMTRIKASRARPPGEDVTAEMEDLRRETEVQRSDLRRSRMRASTSCSRSLCRCSRRAACRLGDWRC